MTENILGRIRSSSPNLSGAIIRSVTVDRSARTVSIDVVTDKAFTDDDKRAASEILRGYVPSYFGCGVEIIKLTPDCEMVERKIKEILSVHFRTVYATLTDGDISVKKTEDGFEFTIYIMPSFNMTKEIAAKVAERLKSYFCGQFRGNCLSNGRTADDIEIEEKIDEPDFVIPVRKFDIEDFSFLEGSNLQTQAIYMADLNLAGDEAVVCGAIESIRVRTYTNKKGQEKNYLSLALSDGTATMYTTYFLRQRSAEKIMTLKEGDSIVCTGRNEVFNGCLRFTATTIDYGRVPKNFVPEKRFSKPVPLAYHCVKPAPFVDTRQGDMFADFSLPDCLTDNTFVVFDLETTGLNSSAVSGNMDAILEIGAFKIEGGKITQSFSTFVDPERRLSEEITSLTGITEDMVKNAPSCAEVMPDFFKFCNGCILVGHNVVGFDFKFVDHYCAKEGYILERKLIDTITLSQELIVGLSNYKLNTIASYFGITFNHHRATDDSLATAKIFIELLKLKKSLPKLQ